MSRVNKELVFRSKFRGQGQWYCYSSVYVTRAIVAHYLSCSRPHLLSLHWGYRGGSPTAVQAW